MEAKFYLRDDNYVNILGKEVSEKGLLFFSLLRKMKGADFETSFDNRATREHVKNYPTQYREFKNANPDYKLAWPELDIEAAPKVEPIVLNAPVEGIIEPAEAPLEAKELSPEE